MSKRNTMLKERLQRTQNRPVQILPFHKSADEENTEKPWSYFSAHEEPGLMVAEEKAQYNADPPGEVARYSEGTAIVRGRAVTC